MPSSRRRGARAELRGPFPSLRATALEGSGASATPRDLERGRTFLASGYDLVIADAPGRIGESRADGNADIDGLSAIRRTVAQFRRAVSSPLETAATSLEGPPLGAFDSDPSSPPPSLASRSVTAIEAPLARIAPARE